MQLSHVLDSLWADAPARIRAACAALTSVMETLRMLPSQDVAPPPSAIMHQLGCSVASCRFVAPTDISVTGRMLFGVRCLQTCKL